MTSPTYIIAEAGVNHNGSMETAFKLINLAVKAGADAVKFQTFKTELSLSKNAPKPEYQIQTTGDVETQFEMAKKLELGHTEHRELLAHCQKNNIQFLSTAFDLPSLDLLVDELKVPRLKVPSGDILNGPLVLKIAQTGLPTIVSTGMCTLGEVEQALGVLAFGYLNDESKTPSLEALRLAYASPEGQKALKEKVTLLHCTTEYPTPFCDVNLCAMDSLKAAFGLSTGLSDHTSGISVSLAAVARGASLVEKHFTLDKSMPGPDHQASLSPDELIALVKSIREIEEALGNSVKVPAHSEIKNIAIARKSLVAATPIKKGELFTPDNLTCLRPGSGILAINYWEWLGKPARRDYEPDTLIDE